MYKFTISTEAENKMGPTNLLPGCGIVLGGPFKDKQEDLKQAW